VKIIKSSFLNNQVLSGTLLAMLVNVGGVGLVFFVNLFIARNSSVDVYGGYLFVVSIFTIASLVSLVGFDSLLSRLVPEYSSLGMPFYIKGVLCFGLGVVCFYSALLSVVVFFSGFVPVDGWVYFVLPALALSFYLQSVFRSFKKVVLSRVFDQIVRPIVFVVLLCVCSFYFEFTLGLSVVLACFLVSIFISLAIGSAVFFVTLYPIFKGDTAKFKVNEWFYLGSKMLVITLGFVLFSELDVIVVGFILDEEAVAMIGVSVKLAGVTLLGLQASSLVGAPMLSEAHVKNDKVGLLRVVKVVSRTSAFFSGAVVVLLFFCGEYILSFFGDDYLSAYSLVMTYSFGFFISSFFGPAGYLLLMTGRENMNVILVYSALFLNVILNIPAVIYYGVEGAAVVTAVLVVVRSLATWYVALRRLGVNTSVLP